MKTNNLYFYRLDPSKMLSKLITMGEQERGGWIIRAMADLISNESDDTFVKSMITEAKSYSAVKREAANKRWNSNARALHMQSTSNAEHMQSNAPVYTCNANNNNNNKKNKTKTSVERKSLEEIILPEWFPKDSYLEFLSHRESLKKPMTELAVQKMIKYLDSVRGEYDIVMLLDRAIRSQWQSVYLSDDCKLQTVSKQPYC